MTVDLVLIILAGICGVALIIDNSSRPWAGLGIIALAVALLV
jgi:hypothetical protein